MELIVDLIEITRIPYNELETVYISSNLAIIPNGSRCHTKISSGNKIVKLNPHRFSFLIDDVINNPNSSLVITVCSHMTNFRQIPISYVSIPLNTIPHRSIASLSLDTTSLSSYSITPIVVISLGIDINDNSARMHNEISISKNVPKIQLQHPSAILGIDYSTCEDPPSIEFDSFGRLKPPENYISKCEELIIQDRDLFNKLIKNGALRKFVLNRATEYYNNLENNITFKENENNVSKPSSNQSKKSKKKFSKGSITKNPDLIPQPPLDPPNPRRQIRNDENSLETQENQSQIALQTQRQLQQAIKKEMWTISINNMKSNQARKSNNQPPQHSMMAPPQQIQQQTQPHQNASPPQNPPIGQIAVISPMSQIPHKTESPPKPFVHGVAVDPKKSLRQKPQTGQDIEIQKPLILKKKGAPDYEKPPMRGLLAPKHNEDKGPTLNSSNKKNRTICMAPNKKQKYPDNYSVDNDNYSMDNDNFDKLSQSSMPAVVLNINSSIAPNPIKNQHGMINSHIRNRSPSPTTGMLPSSIGGNDFNPHKNQQPSKIKPQPPPQMQPSMIPQSAIDISPRRPRQSQEY